VVRVIVSAVLMIATGAFGALTVGNVKWVWWFFGMCWFLHIIFALGKSWAEAAKAKGGESGSVYSKIAGITVITWFCYPIVWVFAEGFGNFSVTFEVLLVSVKPSRSRARLLFALACGSLPPTLPSLKCWHERHMLAWSRNAGGRRCRQVKRCEEQAQGHQALFLRLARPRPGCVQAVCRDERGCEVAKACAGRCSNVGAPTRRDYLLLSGSLGEAR
jgi:hypothetical protein